MVAVIIGALHFSHPAEALDTAPATPIASTTKLSLAEAIRLAVRQHPRLAESRIDVRIADARVLEASGADDFVMDASTGWSRNYGAASPAEGGQTPFDAFSAGTGIRRSLPTGGDIGLRLDVEASRPLATDPNVGGSQLFAPSLSLSLSQPLLRGAGVGVARASHRQAQAAKDIAMLQKEATLASVLRDVSEAYWELAYASEELDIRRASLSLAREQLRAVLANIEVGKQPDMASAEVKVAIALREEEELLSEQNLRGKEHELRRMLGLGIGVKEPGFLATERLPSALPKADPERALAITMDHNPELQALRAQGRAASIEVLVSRNGLLPQLDVSISGGALGNSNDAATAFSQMGKFEGYTVQAGLVLSQPIGRRAAQGRADAARETLRKARLSEEDILSQLRTAVLKAVDLVTIAEHRKEALAKATHWADLDLAGEKARFELGRASNFDVLRRQDDLARAQLRQARAKADHVKSLAILESLTAEILTRHRLELR